MRVNVYAEEMTDRVEIVSKEIDGQEFTGLRIYLELPASFHRHPENPASLIPAKPTDRQPAEHLQAPFIHRPGDDDSSAVTFWGKRDLRVVLRKALAMLDEHYAAHPPQYRSAIEEIAAERRRQIEEEGWTAEHDDRHPDRSLAAAAAAYAYFASLSDAERAKWGERGHHQYIPLFWPASWARRWWKPSSPRRDLVKAAALIVAEIERLDRAAARAEGET